MKSSTFPSLEGLDDLARRSGVDIRPTLVRVLTDLYVQKPAHSLEEELHYTELVQRLLDAVDVPTRVIVANKLAAYPQAPRPILRRLARDVIEVAEPVLRHSPCFNGPELIAIIEECGPRYAAAIAARKGREPEKAPAAGHVRLSPSSRERMWARSTRSFDETRAHSGLLGEMETGVAPATTDIGLADLFFAARSAERRVILANLDSGEDVRPRPTPQAAGAIERLEAAALAHRPEDFVHELERALDLNHELAHRMVDDDGGEPLVVAAKALGMPSEVLLRILLLLNPAIGQSVPRVFSLVQLNLELTPAAALRLVGTLRSGAKAREPVHQPVLWNDEIDSGRRAAVDAARRSVGATPTSQTAAQRREESLNGQRHGTT